MLLWSFFWLSYFIYVLNILKKTLMFLNCGKHKSRKRGGRELRRWSTLCNFVGGCNCSRHQANKSSRVSFHTPPSFLDLTMPCKDGLSVFVSSSIILSHSRRGCNRTNFFWVLTNRSINYSFFWTSLFFKFSLCRCRLGKAKLKQTHTNEMDALFFQMQMISLFSSFPR